MHVHVSEDEMIDMVGVDLPEAQMIELGRRIDECQECADRFNKICEASEGITGAEAGRFLLTGFPADTSTKH